MIILDTEKPFCPTTLVEWVQLFSYIFSIVAIIIALITYNSNKKLKRAEWLKSLFEKFYENQNYKSARKWLDFGEIELELSNDNDHIKEEQVSDFLNFFEFLATLEKENQITHTEIEHIFAYYLTKIKESDFCKKYIDAYKFENLKKLLNKEMMK